jgi:hypothetical protein
LLQLVVGAVRLVGDRAVDPFGERVEDRRVDVVEPVEEHEPLRVLGGPARRERYERGAQRRRGDASEQITAVQITAVQR